MIEMETARQRKVSKGSRMGMAVERYKPQQSGYVVEEDLGRSKLIERHGIVLI